MTKYEDLFSSLRTNAIDSYLGSLRLRNTALADTIRTELQSESGNKLFASPLIQRKFGFQESDLTFQEYAENKISSQLVDSMDSPPEGFESFAFRKDFHPYTHQEKAWDLLLDGEPKSLVISSGTGSGKTECFLVPIFQDLIAQKKPKGVQALMLYPLNALINSQKDRLSAWLRRFEGDVRYALYNGNTPETHGGEAIGIGVEQVGNRTHIRDPETMPNMLLTNTTMLEMILNRPEDATILKESKGKLKYIVLDEAHTYLGSSAAELALLLRRTMDAFGVQPTDVRFIATSATISSSDKNAENELKEFLSSISGQPKDLIHVITGDVKPPLLNNEDTNVSIQELLNDVQQNQINPQELFQKMSRCDVSRKMIDAFHEKEAYLVEELTEKLGLDNDSQTYSLLDAGALANNEKSFFCPTRFHLFQRTQGQMYACIDSCCSGKQDSLKGSQQWLWGRLLFQWYPKCPSCSFPVFELIFCSTCSHEYIKVELDTQGTGKNTIQLLKPTVMENPDEMITLTNDDSSLSNEQGRNAQSKEGIIFHPSYYHTNPTKFRDGFNRWGVQEGKIHIQEKEVQFDHDSDEVTHMYTKIDSLCPHCFAPYRSDRALFRSAFTGGPFAVRTNLPLFLRAMPKASKKDEEGRSVPVLNEGKQILMFTDSRTGAARVGAFLQQDIERNWIRSFIFHTVSQRSNNGVATVSLDILRQELQATREFATLFSFKESYMENWIVSEHDFARDLIIREFIIRPIKGNTLETMGLISLWYPFIEPIFEIPDAWSSLCERVDPQMTDEAILKEWKTFLTLVMDFFIRTNKLVNVNRNTFRWMGLKIYPKTVRSPRANHDDQNDYIEKWLSGDRVRLNRSRIGQLLQKIFRLDYNNDNDLVLVDNLFLAAWDALYHESRFLGENGANVYQYDFFNNTSVKLTKRAFLCPVTYKFIHRTLFGYTPYLVSQCNNFESKCTEFLNIPSLSLNECFPTQEQGTKMRAEIRNNSQVRKFRKYQAWNQISDLIWSFQPYFQSHEHSASLNQHIKSQLEQDFKSQDIQVLSCSTTMEMGVDIGGISGVGSSNVPPKASNYLQRIGRAGRRNESKAYAWTVCKSRPHDQEIFANPTLFFEKDLFVTKVQLDSETIVQRHCNAVVYRYFLQSKNLSRLQVWKFFTDWSSNPSPFSAMLSFIEDEIIKERNHNRGELYKSIQLVTKNTCFEGKDLISILNESKRGLEKCKDEFLAMYDFHKDQIDDVHTEWMENDWLRNLFVSNQSERDHLMQEKESIQTNIDREKKRKVNLEQEKETVQARLTRLSEQLNQVEAGEGNDGLRDFLRTEQQHTEEELSKKEEQVNEITTLLNQQEQTFREKDLEIANLRGKTHRRSSVMIDRLPDAPTFNDMDDASTARFFFYQFRKFLRGDIIIFLSSHQFLSMKNRASDIISFDISTKKTHEQSEANKTRENPSRDLPIAIREYAPGAKVVIQNQVYQSSGFLPIGNWITPKGELSHAATVQIQTYYQCKSCSWFGCNVVEGSPCPQCGEVLKRVGTILRPKAFAVRYEAPVNTVIDSPKFIPTTPPLINVSAESQGFGLFDEEPLCYYKTSKEAEILHYSKGEKGFGFCVCLSCGRAESEYRKETNNDNFPKAMTKRNGTHKRLRGGTNKTVPTRGDCIDFKTASFRKRNLFFGGTVKTHAFEISLRNLDEKSWSISSEVAQTIGVAMRNALCAIVGLEEQEIGVLIKKIDKDGYETHSVVLYDMISGGGGFSIQAEDNMEELFQKTIDILKCSNPECENGCNSCLLSFHTQYFARKLRRKTALQFLEKYVHFSSVPDKLKIQGGKDYRWLKQRKLHEMLTQQTSLYSQEDVALRLYFHGEEGCITDWEYLDYFIDKTGEQYQKLEIVISEKYYEKIRYPTTALGEKRASYLYIKLKAAEQNNKKISLLTSTEMKMGESYIWASMQSSENVRLFLTNTVETVKNGFRWLSNIAKNTLFVGCTVSIDTLPQVKNIVLENLKHSKNYCERTIVKKKNEPVLVSEVGEYIWKELNGLRDALQKERMERGALTKISYFDRYINTQLKSGYLHSFLKSIKDLDITDDQTSLHVETYSVKPSKGKNDPAVYVERNWKNHDRQESFLTHMISSLFLNSSIIVSDLSREEIWKLRHERRLELSWNDQKTYIIILEPGLDLFHWGELTEQHKSVGNIEQLLGLNLSIIPYRDLYLFYWSE